MIRKDAIKTACNFAKKDLIISANGFISRDVYSSLEKNTKIVGLEELLKIFPNILTGQIAGRVLIDLNK